MSKFLHLVEQNLPGSSFSDHLDLLMELKSVVNSLFSKKESDFYLVPVEGKVGTVELRHRDGRKCVIYLKANEEAEDLTTKKVPSSSEMAAELVRTDKRVKTSLEPAIRKVTDVLNRYANS